MGVILPEISIAYIPQNCNRVLCLSPIKKVRSLQTAVLSCRRRLPFAGGVFCLYNCHFVMVFFLQRLFCLYNCLFVPMLCLSFTGITWAAWGVCSVGVASVPRPWANTYGIHAVPCTCLKVWSFFRKKTTPLRIPRKNLKGVVLCCNGADSLK